MGKLLITWAAAALLLGSLAWTAHAQTLGAASLHTQAQIASPISKAACGGPGRFCPPGRHRVCGPAHCWCAPC